MSYQLKTINLKNNKMKKILSIVLCLSVTGALTFGQNAESDQQMRTIFGSPEVKSLGGYGALDLGYTTINKRDAVYFGARGAVVLNHSLALGIGGKGFITNPAYDVNLGEDYELAGGYGGFYIEPIIKGNSPVHVSFPMLIGAGGIGYLKHWGDYDYDSDSDYEYENNDEDSYAFFVFEPGVEVEFNVVKWMRFAVVGSYRLTSDIKLNYKDRLGSDDELFAGTSIAPKDMLRGFNVGLIMKFGKF
jgi:Phr family secreted Rap phosphatase inhibitor